MRPCSGPSRTHPGHHLDSGKAEYRQPLVPALLRSFSWRHIGIQAEMDGKGAVQAKGSKHLGLMWGNQEASLEELPATSMS